jgi:spermidine synthase
MPIRTIKDGHGKTLPDSRQFGPDWLVETVGTAEVHGHRIQRVVADMTFGTVRVSVLQTAYGHALVKNDRLQSTEKDEWIYHEALVHPAMIANPCPRSVLCIGGTTGAIVREVLRHRNVEELYVVGVNKLILEALDGEISHSERAVFCDPRVKCLNGTQLDRPILSEKKFDVIIADPPEPSESGSVEKNVYQNIIEFAAKVLAEDGILAIASGGVHPFAESISTLREVFAIAKRHFREVKLGIASVPSLGIPWGMLFCSNNLNVTEIDAGTVDQRLTERGLVGLRFYDGETHIGMYSTPKHVRSWMAER